jgi:hypothetical protein
MQDFLSKARARRSVMKKTRGPASLPSPVLYMEWLSGEMKRRVLDVKGVDHLLLDATLQSNYKLLTGPQAKELLAKHWPQMQATPALPAAK